MTAFQHAFFHYEMASKRCSGSDESVHSFYTGAGQKRMHPLNASGSIYLE